MLQLADALTKVMDPTLLRTMMATGVFQLQNEQASLESNSQKKQAISWFREQSQSRQQQIFGSVISNKCDHLT